MRLKEKVDLRLKNTINEIMMEVYHIYEVHMKSYLKHNENLLSLRKV